MSGFESAETTPRVFVYGTLTDPDRADAVVGPDAYDVVGPAILEGCHRVEGTYPTLAPGGDVTGRVLALEGADVLARLDEYEGVDRGLYVRIPVPLVDARRAADSETDRRTGERDESPADGTVWTYVGDPERLGTGSIAWPGDGPFETCARRAFRRLDIAVRFRE